MKDTHESNGPPRALSSENGETWAFSEGEGPVTTIVIGKQPPRGEETRESVSIRGEVRADLIRCWDGLRELRLWSVGDGMALLEEVPGNNWPPGLRVLDLRGCEMTDLPELPETLEELDLGRCENLERLPKRVPPRLERIFLDGCGALEQESLERFLENLAASEAPVIELDGSGCAALATLPDRLPRRLEDLRLNDCPALWKLPEAWPEALRRLELRNGQVIAGLPDFNEALDYLDLRGTRSLQQLPEASLKACAPRTLFIHDSGLELPDEIFGDEEFNSAGRVLAHLGEKDRVPDNEIKVILVGDGRSGKSSLARRMVEDRFDDREPSTHGIRLWKQSIDFEPHEGGSATVKLNLWDFAGQDLYHNTHRLFFQSKAVFLLCANCCPDGACEETDREEAARGRDLTRHVAYWRDQVESIGAAPGMDGPPPLLVLRTKADRDAEDPGYRTRFHETCGEAIAGLECLDISAKDPEIGLEDLTVWLAKAASRVLGPLGKREIGPRPLEVKRKLEAWMGENDAVHTENEPLLIENEKREQRGEEPLPLKAPPHPRMGRDEFHALTREHCPDGAYHENPGFLLSRFHLSGFLYHDPDYLAEEVILDQRWAIRGIYAAFDRDRAWPVIAGSKGRFRPKLLAAAVWDDLGYTPADQAVFLKFMESCGLAFALDGKGGPESEYVLPAALPEWSDPEVRRQANDKLAGTPPESRPLTLASRFLSRDAMMQLLVRIGRGWRRASDLWRWGGQFESYRNWESRTLADERERTFVRINWSETSEGSYGGTMTVTQYGGDRSFLAAILNECREIGDFEEVEIPAIELPDEEPGDEGPEVARSPEGDRQKLKGHQSDVHANPVTVGISFKGDYGKVESLEELPADSIERWPLAIAAGLREEGFDVQEYRIEQGRHDFEQTQHHKEFLDSLTERDFMVAFLSWPYLESPWCMYEFWRIFRRMENGRLDAATARIGSFRDALFSQGNLDQRHPESGKTFGAHLEDYWDAQYEKFENAVRENSRTLRRGQADESDALQLGEEIDRARKRFAYLEWMECVRNPEEFGAILDALGNWKIHGIEAAPDSESLGAWLGDVVANTLRGHVLMNYARRAKDRNHGLRLFVRGFLAEDRGGQPDGLETALMKTIGDELLDEMREALLGIVAGSAGTIRTWQQLDVELKGREQGG